jgi:hypothetical protein
MQLIREFEVRTMQAYQNRQDRRLLPRLHRAGGRGRRLHAAVSADDPIVTAYRDHGHALARGMDPKYCMAEMFGKIGGCAKGKGGSMHMFDRGPPPVRRARHRRRPDAARGRPRLRRPYEDEVIDGGPEARRAVLPRRRRAQPGRVPRGDEPRVLFDLPVIFIVREQRLLDGHRDLRAAPRWGTTSRRRRSATAWTPP